MFFITGLEKIETDKSGWLDTGASRTFGYYTNLKNAQERVIENACDIFEFLYLYMLIEDIESDCLYPYYTPSVENRWLYKYNFETKKFEQIEEPECMKSVCNFAIG